MGKTNFVLGKRCSNVQVSVVSFEGDVRPGKGKERKGSAKLGPVCEVPWRTINVFPCVDAGRWMKGFGCVVVVIAVGCFEN